MSSFEDFIKFHGQKGHEMVDEYMKSLENKEDKEDKEDINDILTKIENIDINDRSDKKEQLLNDLSEFIPSTNSCKKIEIDDIKGIIFHRGPPPGLHECSVCREKKDNTHYTWYQQRVDKKGYLSRCNAHCSSCSKKVKKEKDETMKKDKDKIPEEPEQGSMCPNCNRSWGTKENPRNWHKDHNAKTHEFRRWLCSNCNMAKHDHRWGIS
jgi:hypothetical protein